MAAPAVVALAAVAGLVGLFFYAWNYVREPDMLKLIEKGPWLFDFQCDWPEWFVGKYNWKNFTLIELSWEHDIILGGIEATAALIGLRLRIRYTYDENTPLNVSLREDMAEYMSCQHDWYLEPEGEFGPHWICRACQVSTSIRKPE